MKKAILILFACFLLSGCTSNKSNECTFFAMDTVMTITVYNSDNEMLTKLQKEVSSLESMLSVTDSNSMVFKLNELKEIEVTEEVKNLLGAALELGDRTNGLFDVSIYPVMKAWGFTENEHQVPERELIDALLKNVDYRRISVSDMTISLDDDMMIDFGGIAKGFTGDILSEMLRENGVDSACINLGGNVQTVGAKPDGSKWRVGIQDPQSDDLIGIVLLKDQVAITSGAYQRFFVGEDGMTYGHIIDPRTGYPADTDLTSVTIIGKTGVIADGLSTALFIMGREEAISFWKASDDFEAVLIDEDGTVWVTDGIQNDFELKNSGYSLEVISK